MYSLIESSSCVPSFSTVTFLLGLKRIQILSNPSPNRGVEANTGYPRIPLDTNHVRKSH